VGLKIATDLTEKDRLYWQSAARHENAALFVAQVVT
jgi:hypothetical protein